jgi:ubiquinone/menaquinone biosynthesis C-methylase UbiE
MNASLSDSYARWRKTTVGELTERLETNLVLDLAGPLSSRRVLDVGCGDGTYALIAADKGASVTAVDTTESMMEAARGRAFEARVEIRFERADASRLPFNDDSFDVVLAVTVLCFVEDATLAVKEAARVLAPGGRLVLADLNRWSTWAAWRRARGWLGSSTWRKARFRTARELAFLARSAGLDVDRRAGAIYYPPVGSVARFLAPLDVTLGAITTLGAAFVAVAARK